MKRLGIEITDRFRTLTALTLIPILILSCGFACNAQTWISNINSILAEVGPALQIVTSLLPLFGAQIPSSVPAAVNTWVPKIQADVAEIEKVVKEVQGDLATNPTSQAKINAVIQTAVNDVNEILPVFQVLNADTKAKIVGLVNAIAAAIQSVMIIVNRIEGKLQAKAANAGFVRDGKDFKVKFNSILHAPSTPEVDQATTKLNL